MIMDERWIRSSLLLGEDGINKLNHCHVAVFGVGGVGGFVVEALARTGIGNFDLIDKDEVDISNINRQIIATTDSIGRQKTEVCRERILSINPEAQVNIHPCFFLPDNSDDFDFTKYDYVVDAVDTVTAKIEIIRKAKEAGIPVISSMGAGNKLDPTAFQVADISKTSVCPLAKVVRRELKKRNITDVKVVYSTEVAKTPLPLEQKETSQEAVNQKEENNTITQDSRKQTPGSVSFVPSVAGLIIAGEVIKDLSEIQK